eukprot:2508118-Rhodomonas_salina.1
MTLQKSRFFLFAKAVSPCTSLPLRPGVCVFLQWLTTTPLRCRRAVAMTSQWLRHSDLRCQISASLCCSQKNVLP